MLEKTGEEKLKEVLLHVLRIDNIVNRFHNKVQFMNLNFMMGRIDTWDEDRIEKVLEAIVPVYNDMTRIQETVDEMQGTVQTLIESYSFTKESPEETTEL